MMTPEEKAKWLEARAGRLTASRMAAALAYRKDGKPTAERTDYLKDLLAERMADASARHYVSPAMEWGILHEDDAKMAYEAATGILLTDPKTVREWGLFYHPENEYFAASPDALIDDDGLAEFKCPTTSTFVDWVMAGVIPEAHKPQMLAQLACCRRKWCEFVAFDPRVKDPARRLFIRRFEPTAEEIAHVEAGAWQFLAELERAWDVLAAAA